MIPFSSWSSSGPSRDTSCYMPFQRLSSSLILSFCLFVWRGKVLATSSMWWECKGDCYWQTLLLVLTCLTVHLLSYSSLKKQQKNTLRQLVIVLADLHQSLRCNNSILLPPQHGVVILRYFVYNWSLLFFWAYQEDFQQFIVNIESRRRDY